MKKKMTHFTRTLGVLSLSFALAGGISAVNAKAESNAVSITDNKLMIGDKEITAEYARFTTSEKAAVRYNPVTDSQGIEYTGLRFLSWIDEGVYNDLLASQDYKVSFGTLIANADTVEKAGDFTKDALPQNTETETNYKDAVVKNIVAEDNETSKQTDVVEFSAVLYGTTGEANFAKQRKARAYLTVTSVEDESQSVTIYANYNAESSRSIADVSISALEANDYDTKEEDAEEKEFKALTTYAKASSAWKTGYDYMRWISSLEELQKYAPNAGTYLTMKNDISMAEVKPSDWDNYGATKGVGYVFSVIPELNATLDGNNKKLHGLTLKGDHLVVKDGEKAAASNVGCFGVIGTSGGIRNLVFIGSLGSKTVTDNGDGTTTETLDNIISGHIGLLAWKNQGTIENMYVQGQIIARSGSAKNPGTFSVGMVFVNTGTIRGVISDIRFEGSASSSKLDTPKAYFERFTFAVSNQGENCQVSNCIALNAQYTDTETPEYGTWTTSPYLTKKYDPDNGVTATWGTELHNSGKIYSNSNTSGYKGISYTVANHADDNRENCYIFNTYEDLLDVNSTNGDGVGTTADVTKNVASSKAQKELKDIGGAWSFDAENGVVKLGETIVWSRQA